MSIFLYTMNSLKVKVCFKLCNISQDTAMLCFGLLDLIIIIIILKEEDYPLEKGNQIRSSSAAVSLDSWPL